LKNIFIKFNDIDSNHKKIDSQHVFLTVSDRKYHPVKIIAWYVCGTSIWLNFNHFLFLCLF